MAYLRDIDRCRRNGYATEAGEYIVGVSGVSKALVRDGRPIGALAVVAPTARCHRQAQSLRPPDQRMRRSGTVTCRSGLDFPDGP